ncbi:30S ribosome-binding factor RbfA [Bifidobacterium mongoliense]|jgi:ribosome-binding factor A|uniref:Ribosome-binding factor A n=2 Tax=Bifidobacterium mongoliense TaxID=518643 RepID=A0A087BWQ4_9BIFI|nr:30S ribosome-binding factor RbfA [Bifidobacterium mongoliense]KFI75454.1 ribosome-binding factor A [Bifidobacterium mongoliense DSM 21395]ROT87151.1 ribosome-binding factor A [Bifidobacterium mongoliense]
MAGTNPRAARIAALIQRVIASAIERQLHDKRLSRVTVTEVRVTNDLQIATVYWTQFGSEGKERGERDRAQQALRQASGKLRSLVGTKAGLRLTPQLRFVYDEVPEEATEIEDILVAARHRDEELAKAREHAQYAGEADPYRHDEKPVVDGDDADVPGEPGGSDARAGESSGLGADAGSSAAAPAASAANGTAATADTDINDADGR